MSGSRVGGVAESPPLDLREAPMVRNFEAGDKGSEVHSADGDMIGTVTAVKGDRLHVKPADTLSRNIRQALGWEGDEEEYELRHSTVDKIAGNEIHLKESF